jgi:UDP-N-acetylmuramoyl-tripeptide--D-alanyl-D-alanine ligase
MQLTISEVAGLSGAETVVASPGPGQALDSFCWDSREIGASGSLFVAIPGERLDGNDFIVQAIERGASCVMASRPPSQEEQAAAQRHHAALLYVDDSIIALQRLAAAYRGRLGAKTVGITGSSGKTSTRLLVEAVLSQGFKTVASIGNRNNELGVPATVLSADMDTEVLVIEMAMRGIGQIDELCDIARPDIGIITNIGPAHLELLGSKQNIAKAKAELISALPDRRGIAILNGDDAYSSLIRELAQTQQRGLQVLQFGLQRQNDIRADHIEFDAQGHPSFDLWLTDARPRRISLRLQGRHSVLNALSAAACGIALGMGAEQISAALAAAQPAPMRQVSQELPDGSLLIDDSYNANPDSMRVALEVLAQQAKRPHVAVLGDMGELGKTEAQLHRDVGAIVAQTSVDHLIAVGSLARHYVEGAVQAGMPASQASCCDDIEEALALLAPSAPLRGSAPVILVKASRFMGLERVVERLKLQDISNSQSISSSQSM